MGGIPTKEAPDRICSLHYGNHEIGLIPLTRRYFGEEDSELKRQYIRVRNDPSVRYNHCRATVEYSMTELPPPSYTMDQLEQSLNEVEAQLFDTNAEFLHATDDNSLRRVMALIAFKQNQKHLQRQEMNRNMESHRVKDINPGAYNANDDDLLENSIIEHAIAAGTMATNGIGGDYDENKNCTNPIRSPTDKFMALGSSRHASSEENKPGKSAITIDGGPSCAVPPPHMIQHIEGDRIPLSETDFCDLTPEEREALHRCKRQLRPVPCAVVFVYVNGRDGMDCFQFHGRMVNVIGFCGCRAYDDERDDDVPYLQIRAATLKAAGDRTLERVLFLAAKLYVEQYFQIACERLPSHTVGERFHRHISMLPLVSVTQWNSYPAMKFLYDATAFSWAAEELRAREEPQMFIAYERSNGEKGVIVRASGALLARSWIVCTQLLQPSIQRGDWAQYVLDDRVQHKNKLMARWEEESPDSKLFLGGAEFTTAVVRHLRDLHQEIVRARETSLSDTSVWIPGEERSHDGKVYRIFNSPLCGPFLTTVKTTDHAKPSRSKFTVVPTSSTERKGPPPPQQRRSEARQGSKKNKGSDAPAPRGPTNHPRSFKGQSLVESMPQHLAVPGGHYVPSMSSVPIPTYVTPPVPHPLSAGNHDVASPYFPHQRQHQHRLDIGNQQQPQQQQQMIIMVPSPPHHQQSLQGSALVNSLYYHAVQTPTTLPIPQMCMPGLPGQQRILLSQPPIHSFVPSTATTVSLQAQNHTGKLTPPLHQTVSNPVSASSSMAQIPLAPSSIMNSTPQGTHQLVDHLQQSPSYVVLPGGHLALMPGLL